MKQLLRQSVSRYRRPSPGYTLVELVLVVALVGILSAMATPAYLQWRDNIVYRRTANDMMSVLRRAKSEAISSNREHRVEIDPVRRRFYWRRGAVSVNVDWNDFVNNPLPVDIITAPPQVAIVPSPPAVANAQLNLVFRPNGTTDITGADATVQIRDAASGTTRYWVNIAASGRIRVCNRLPCP
jgi:prepilin-type N-terminal cleavage/methylation domain-containing protein